MIGGFFGNYTHVGLNRLYDLKENSDSWLELSGFCLFSDFVEVLR